MMSFVPIVAPEGEPGLFHSDNIFESMAMSELYGYVVFFVVGVLFFVMAGLFARFYLILRDGNLQQNLVGCYNKIKRMF